MTGVNINFLADAALEVQYQPSFWSQQENYTVWIFFVFYEQL